MRGVGHWVMSHRHLPSLRVSWRVFRRRPRTQGWSWDVGRMWVWIPWGWSASAGMASHAACGICPHAGWWRQFSTDPQRGRRTRPSREGSAQAHFRSSQSCVWDQRCHHLGGGVGVGVSVCGGVMRTGRPGGILVVLCCGGASGFGGVSVRGPVGTRTQSPLRGWVWSPGGGGSGAFVGFGQTSEVGRAAGTLLAGPGVASVRLGAVRGPGVRALSDCGTRCIAPWPRRAPT